jgi:RNA polymerase primary sigma factor
LKERQDDLSIEDKYEGVKELLVAGKEKGYLLYDEVNDALPDDIESSEDLDSIFYLFGDAGIEVIDSEQQFGTGAKRRRRKASEEEQESDFTPETLEKTNDPVRMYLREMGTVPLLTREGEVEIAKRIEKGQLTVLKALSRSPVVVAEIMQWGQKLEDNGLNIKTLVTFTVDEVTEEFLAGLTSHVLTQFAEIAQLEVEASKAHQRLRRAKKDTARYKKLLSQLARYRIPIARKIRDLHLTTPSQERLALVIKNTVDRVVALEKEARRL